MQLACLQLFLSSLTLLLSEMGRALKYLTVLLLLLLSFFCFNSEAKSLKVMTNIDGSLRGFSVGAVKRSGPSPRGPGHRLRRYQTQQFGGQTSGGRHLYFSRFHHWFTPLLCIDFLTIFWSTSFSYELAVFFLFLFSSFLP